MSGDDVLMKRQADLWRLLYNPSSPLFIYQPLATINGTGAAQNFLPGDTSRIMFGFVGSTTVEVIFDFNDNALTVDVCPANQLKIYKVDEHGPLVQSPVKIITGLASLVNLFVVRFRF